MLKQSQGWWVDRYATVRLLRSVHNDDENVSLGTSFAMKSKRASSKYRQAINYSPERDHTLLVPLSLWLLMSTELLYYVAAHKR